MLYNMLCNTSFCAFRQLIELSFYFNLRRRHLKISTFKWTHFKSPSLETRMQKSAWCWAQYGHKVSIQKQFLHKLWYHVLFAQLPSSFGNSPSKKFWSANKHFWGAIPPSFWCYLATVTLSLRLFCWMSLTSEKLDRACTIWDMTSWGQNNILRR